MNKSADPAGFGVSEFMVHPVPLNSPYAQTAQILRFSDSQILSILKFSDSSNSLDSQILRATDRTGLSIQGTERPV